MNSKANDLHAWNFIPDLDKENKKLLKMYKPHAKAQAQAELTAVERELHAGINWEIDDYLVDHWVGGRQKYLQEINERTFGAAREAVDAAIKEAIEDNLTPAEMAKKIKEAVYDVYEVRLGKPPTPHGDFDLGGMSSSKTIARTEMGTIASLARYDAFEKEEVEEIEWITAKDERVRGDHVALDGKTVKLGSEFSPGLRFPRDPNGKAGDVINCRCGFIAAR